MQNDEYDLGCRMPLEKWLWLNRTGIFENPELRRFVSPFPPAKIMQSVSGLTEEKDFASHGADFFRALSAASPKPLTDYRHLLDFGCGCGRLARLFKGHPHLVSGCDIDCRQVEWVRNKLEFMDAQLSSVRPPLPYTDNTFDGIISISIFSHLNEKDQDLFLRELYRVAQPESYLFLTIHGKTALDRSKQDEKVKEMISVDEDLFRKACENFSAERYVFILQHGHLTNLRGKLTVLEKLKRLVGIQVYEPTVTSEIIADYYEYGITYIPEAYVRTHWTKWFDIVDYIPGGIYGWQDIVVLSPRK